MRAGDGDDALFLRDGEADACFDVGGGSNRVDADLVDQAGTCLDLLVNVTLLTVGARRERPNVLVRSSRLDLGSRIGVNLHCPRRSGGCAGTARLTNARGRGVLATTRYSLRAGRRGRAVFRLNSSARRRAARLERARVTAVEKGVFGPKTTVAVLPIG